MCLLAAWDLFIVNLGYSSLKQECLLGPHGQPVKPLQDGLIVLSKSYIMAV